MAKLSKEEFLKKIDEYDFADDIKISLMEDISDSLEDSSSELDTLKAEIERLTAELEDFKKKYKERFLSAEEVAEELKDEVNESEVYEEKAPEDDVIDVKDIFVDEEERKEDEE